MGDADIWTAFISARLDEDERELVKDPPQGLGYANLGARMRREIRAKREIIGWHVPLEDCEPPQCIVCLEYVPCRTLRALAAIWSDHPAYPAAGASADE